MIIGQTGLKEIIGKDNFHAEEESEIEEYIQSAFPTPGPSPLRDMTGGPMGPMGYHSMTKIASPSPVVDRLIRERRPSGHLKNYVVAPPPPPPHSIPSNWPRPYSAGDSGTAPNRPGFACQSRKKFKGEVTNQVLRKDPAHDPVLARVPRPIVMANIYQLSAGGK